MTKSTQSRTVGEAIQEFYSKNNLGENGGEKRRFSWIKFGFFSFPILNLNSRNKNVYLHDINHIITKNEATWKGESAVSAWEIASGGWGNIYIIWFLALWTMGLGVLIYPKTVLKSFKQGQTMNNALTCGLSKEELLRFSSDDLSKYVSNKTKRNSSPYFWMVISFIVFALPFTFFFVVIWACIIN